MQPVCVVHEGNYRGQYFISLRDFCYLIGFMSYLIKKVPLMFSQACNLLKCFNVENIS